MNVKRLIYLTAILACLAIVIGNGRWEGRLTLPHHSWIMDLERSPVWSPPDTPKYDSFAAHFQRHGDFPASNTPDLKIKRVLKINFMAIHFLLYVWPVLIIFGILNISKNGNARDIFLHIGFCGGIGLTVGAVACILLWLFFGGWGPPAPLFFGITGTAGGFIYGYKNFIYESHEISKPNGQQ